MVQKRGKIAKFTKEMVSISFERVQRRIGVRQDRRLRVDLGRHRASIAWRMDLKLP